MVGFLRITHPILAFASRDTHNNILFDATMTTNTEEDALQNLRSLGLHKKDLPHHAELKRASVLVPLFRRDSNEDAQPRDAANERNNSNLHVLFARRPTSMSSHGGEVCFPGGRQDAEDGGDDVATAAREAFEEVGLHPRHVDAVGRMETVESERALCVTPIVGLIVPPSKAEPSNLSLNADEVEAAFAVPLAYFANPENIASQATIEYGRRSDFVMRTYLFDDVASGRQFRIWGLTAHIAHAVAQIAFKK